MEDRPNRNPLVPNRLSSRATVLDISPLLKDVFRDFLERDVVSHPNENVLKICREMEKANLELREAEREIMKTQGQNMINQHEGKKEVVDVPAMIAKKYTLITMNDVKIEKPFDKNTCKYLPEEFYINDAVAPRIWHKPEVKVERKRIQTEEVKILAEPATLVFRTYELGKQYKRILKIKNMNKTPCKVRLHPGDNMDITVETQNGIYSTTLVKGICWNLTVKFKPSSLEPFENTITISALKGEKLKVLVTGKRDPPVLLSGMPGGKALGLRESFLSGTIDCGAHFVGSTWSQTQSVVNTGSDAMFVIINEESWILADIKHESRIEVRTEPFTISPPSFTLNRNECMVLTATFSPTTVGTFTEQFTVVCNNNTMRTIDLIGDSVLFYPATVVIEHASKDYDVEITDDFEAEYHLNLGDTLPDRAVSKSFKVVNKSDVAISFHWEQRDAENISSSFRHLKEEFLEIQPACGSISPTSEVFFEVFVMTSGLDYSHYRRVLRLVIDDLPEQCILMEDHDQILCSDENNVVSVLQGELEVWITVQEPLITLSPNIYQFRTYEFRNVEVAVTVNNCSEYSVPTRWEVPDVSDYGGVMTITPQTFILQPNESFIYKIMIIPINVEYDEDIFIDTPIRCYFNNSESFVIFHISGELLKDKEFALPLVSECLGEQPSCITDIIGLEPVKADGGLVELCSKVMAHKLNNVGAPDQNCTNEICATIEEQIDEACDPMESKVICGLVHWPISRTGAYTWVISDMAVPEASFSLTCLDVNLYCSVTHTAKVYIVNHTLVNAVFRWVPFKGSENLLDISFDPWEGLLQPGEKKDASIIFQPKEVGVVKSMLACYLDNKKSPLCMKLVANISQLLLEFKWVSRTEEMVVLWTETLKSIDHECVGCSVVNKSGERVIQDSHHTLDEDTLITETERTYSSLSMQEVDVLGNLLDELYGNAPLIGGKYTINNQICDDDEEMFCMDLRTRRPFPEGKKVPKKNASMGIFQTLLDCITEVMDRKSLYFEINLNEKVHKDLIIRNVTPIDTSIEVEPHLVPPAFQSIYTSEVRSTVGSLYQRNFYKCFGCTIEATPSSSTLDGYSALRVKLVVEAKAWGEYMDLIVVKVRNRMLPPFSVPVKVVARGIPIFPMFAPYSDRPHLDFGVIMPKGKTMQSLTMKNSTGLPLKVSWTMYNNPDEDNRLPEPVPEFSVGIDYHHPDKEKMLTVHLIEYIGEQYPYAPYKVSPTLTYFEPFGTAFVNISLNTERIQLPEGKDFKDIEATLTGLIYIDKELDEVDTPGICYRPQGFYTDIFKMDMSVRVEKPLIAVLNYERGDFQFDVKASHAWKGYKMQRRFLLENRGTTGVDVRLEINPPFRISSLISPDPSARVNLFRNIIHLSRKEAATMELELHLTKEYVPSNDIEDFEFSNRNLNEASTETMLNIYASDTLYQQVAFSYKLIYPILVPRRERVVFGPVFVGDTKVKYLAIHSESGDEPFSVSLMNGTEFSVTPSTGFIQGNKFLDLCVTFTPKESHGYLDKMVLRSVVPGYATLVTLEGVGTWNYKFHQDF